MHRSTSLRPGMLGALTSLFAALLAAGTPSCSGDEAGGVGASCEPESETPCGEGLLCTPADDDAHTCTYPAGAACDPDDEALERGGCGPDATCAPASAAPEGAAGGGAEGGEGVCLLVEGAACDPARPACDADLVCAETVDGSSRCFGRVVLRGTVRDTADDAPIAGAQVIALDAEGAAVTDVALSAASGSYSLDLPVVRGADGAPQQENFTLDASAQGYQPFPAGARVALPIDTASARRDGRLYVVEDALTDIGLIALPEAVRFSIEGRVAGMGEASRVDGALVVASGEAGAFRATTDSSGSFTVFNLPSGTYTLRVYSAGLQVGEEQVEVDDQAVEGVLLEELDEPTTTVSGSISLVNAPGGAKTSVILVVADTFDEAAARGAVPRGLRAPASGPVSIDGAFTIEGVPAGEYVVLAAFENDGLVRDPDTSIAGTDFVRLSVELGAPELSISEGFKVTEALSTIFPGAEAPEAVDEKPLLEWADDSGEEWYDVRVFDALGSEVWSALEVPGVSGAATVTLPYEGPLEPGMYYQFRVTSVAQSGGRDPAPKSATEDLRGVFFLPAP